MLPLYPNFKNISFFFLIILTSCSTKTDKDLAAIKILEEGIENSNRLANVSIIDLMNSLETKLHDYPSKERAEVWIPKAKAVQKISDETIKKIVNFKNKIEAGAEKKFNKDDITNIVNILLDYKTDILQVDSNLTKDYRKYLKIFAKSFDSLEDSQKKKIKEYFSEVRSPIALAMLTKIENNIRLNEQGMITYCHEMSTPIFCGFRNSYAAIAILNTSLVEPKGELEITAGMGSFSNYHSPKVFIYDRLFKITEDGAVHHKFKAVSNPGKYYIPIRIEYIDENGKQNSIKKEIEYTVANIQEQ